MRRRQGLGVFAHRALAGFVGCAALVVPISAALAVSPVLDCVDDNGDGTYTAHFGYNNTNVMSVTIPVGSNNRFIPNPQGRGQPTTFLPGSQTFVFSVVWDGSTLQWFLDSHTATAAASSTRCSTPTPTATASATATATQTPTLSPTATATPTETETPAATASTTATGTETATVTVTATATATPTETETPAATATVTVTATVTATPTAEGTVTATVTVTVTQTPTPTQTPTSTRTGICALTPVPGCATPVGFKKPLRLSDKRERASWRWRTIGDIPAADFGNPLTTTSYSLCVYAGAPAALVLELRVPAGGTCAAGKPCWKQRGARGFRYKNLGALPDGVTHLVLRTSVSHLADLALKARGPNIPFPPLPLDQPVVAQLVRSGGPECWQSNYSAPAIKNTTEAYKDKND